jgi:serine/threonine protein kinase
MFGMVDTQGDALLGRMVGSYRVVAAIGAGGMGQVYEAVHPEISTRVAIKVLRPDRVSLTLVQRFFVEARAVARIGHPNIVRVIDLDSLEDGSPFIVMELLHGETLGARLEERGPLALSELVHVGGALCDALSAAHAAGVIHRDIKPDNLLLTREGAVKVLDFGIAKLQHDPQAGVPLTVTGAVLGTPAFMAPEQVAAQTVDARADLYAAGALLYAAATGRPPFEGDNKIAVMEQHLRAEPVSPRVLRPELSPALERAILRALAKRPADRPASAAELAAELRAALPSASTAIAPPPTLPGSPPPRVLLQPGPPPPRARRRGPLLAGVAAVSGVVVAGAVLLAWPAPTPPPVATAVSAPRPPAPAPFEPFKHFEWPASSVPTKPRVDFDPGIAIDPGRLDADEFFVRSLAVARQRLGGEDVMVFQFNAREVDANGVTVARGLARLEVGVRRGGVCVHLSVGNGVAGAYEESCAEGLPDGAMPNCPISRIVSRALEKHGHRGPVTLRYLAEEKRWSVHASRPGLATWVPDDCPLRQR